MNLIHLLLLLIFTIQTLQQDAAAFMNIQTNDVEHPVYTYGPHAKDYENASVEMDDGHRQLLLFVHADPLLGAALAYNWTGRERLCHCTSTDCGMSQIVERLKDFNLTDVCIGQACYRKKSTLFVKDKWEYEDHFGCYGGDHGDHASFANSQQILCMSTSRVNTGCCTESRCNKDIELTFPPIDESYVHVPEPVKISLSTLFAILFLFICTSLFAFVIMVIWFPNVPLSLRKVLVKKFHIVAKISANVDRLPEALQPMLPMESGGSTTARSNISSNQSNHSSNVSSGNTQQTNLSETHSDDTRGALSSLINDLDSSNSGSGSGLPMLSQRTITRQVELLREIGQGRFGEVWLGRWRGQNVAVKVFTSRDDHSYFREVETFQTHLLRHPNVLQFYASEQKDDGVSTRMWMITEYHAYGSLFDYLSKEVIDEVTAVSMIRTLANGLAYLHVEIPGSNGTDKPAIAHRDIKSKNILVRKDLQLVIADLGLAVKYSQGNINIPSNARCGTIRYLSPEILDNAFEANLFDSYRYADIYAMGLIIWEIARRTQCAQGPAASFEHSIPYYEFMLRDPTIDEMRDIVYTKMLRPEPSEHWNENPTLRRIYRVMKECWTTMPMCRLTATNVRIAMDNVMTTLVDY